MLYVVKEAICCMNTQFFFKQDKEKKSSSKSQMQSELQSHTVSFRRTFHAREVQEEHMTQYMEHQEAQLRIQLQN